MSAVAECAVHRHFSGLGRKDCEDFGHYDRAMRAGRGFAGSEDFGDGDGVALGIVFLVFLLKAARMFAGVARAPTVGRDAGDSHSVCSSGFSRLGLGIRQALRILRRGSG